MSPAISILTRSSYICIGLLGLVMGFLCYLGPSPLIDREHVIWWGWVVAFTILLFVGVSASFFTQRHWPDYVVAVGAFLLCTWQTRSAIAILNVKPPFHSSPWTVVIVIGVLLIEFTGLISAFLRTANH